MEENNDRQGENIVEFIKNKNSLKRKIENDKEEKEEKEEDDGRRKKRKLPRLLETHYSEKFNEYLKKKNFKEKNGRIKIGRTIINKEDLIYDVSHMAEKPTSFNLRSDVTKKRIEKNRNACCSNTKSETTRYV